MLAAGGLADEAPEWLAQACRRSPSTGSRTAGPVVISSCRWPQSTSVTVSHTLASCSPMPSRSRPCVGCRAVSTAPRTPAPVAPGATSSDRSTARSTPRSAARTSTRSCGSTTARRGSRGNDRRAAHRHGELQGVGRHGPRGQGGVHRPASAVRRGAPRPARSSAPRTTRPSTRTDSSSSPPTAHMRRVHAQAPQERILRRPYNYDDGNTVQSGRRGPHLRGIHGRSDGPVRADPGAPCPS